MVHTGLNPYHPRSKACAVDLDARLTIAFPALFAAVVDYLEPLEEDHFGLRVGDTVLYWLIAPMCTSADSEAGRPNWCGPWSG